VATLGDGSEETIRTITSSADSFSGTVSYNSPAEGVLVDVLVESYDSEGNLVDSDYTNANGVYTVKEADELRVNGFTASYGDVNLCTVASNEGTSVPSLLMDGDGSSSSPYEISTASDLQAMQEDLSANYIVVNDIDASCTVNWNNGKGFNPVGTYDEEQANSEFTGSFDGQNHTIRNLSINRLYDDFVGLFGAIGAGGEVKNVGVINVNITVESNDVGGLVGYNEEGNISNSYSTGNVTGEYDVGGLVGENYKGNISNSYSTGNVTGGEDVGGLVGENYKGNISNSYSTGNVTGDNKVGGLVGFNYQGTVSNSYSTGNVTGDISVGGLVGDNYNGKVSNSYSTGNVTGEDYVGGLVGEHYGTVSNSYSTGNVTGDRDVGGLVGYGIFGSVSDSYWDTEATGQSSSDGGNVITTTSEMQGSSAEGNMNLDFKDTWSTVEGDYPELQWQE
jgi:hypothetical protein